MGQAPEGMAQVPIIKPGAPGRPARELSAEEAIKIADTSYSPADMQFMQDMIPHHHQALLMAALVADRTNRPELIDVAGRINGARSILPFCLKPRYHPGDQRSLAISEREVCEIAEMAVDNPGVVPCCAFYFDGGSVFRRGL